MSLSKNIVLLALGDVQYHNQALFVVNNISKSYQTADITIHIFTDKPFLYSTLAEQNLLIHYLNDIEIEKSKGHWSFVLRTKIYVIEKVANQTEGSILFIDTDCLIIENYNKLFARLDSCNFIMYQKEYKFIDIDNDFFRLIKGGLLEMNQNYDLLSKYRLLDFDYDMWNSGVIGGQSYNLLSNLKDIYRLTDLIYKISKSHISEQLAFSIVFQRKGRILSADDIIYHYWNEYEKKFMNDYIRILNMRDRIVLKRKRYNSLPQIISSSYIVNKHKAIHSLECNDFLSGYAYSLKAFIKNPIMDSEIRSNLHYHMSRHVKHLVKLFLSKN